MVGRRARRFSDAANCFAPFPPIWPPFEACARSHTGQGKSLILPQHATGSAIGMAARTMFRAALVAAAALSCAAHAAVVIDLSYVNQQSSEFARFKNFVDDAVAGNP